MHSKLRDALRALCSAGRRVSLVFESFEWKHSGRMRVPLAGGEFTRFAVSGSSCFDERSPARTNLRIPASKRVITKLERSSAADL